MPDGLAFEPAVAKETSSRLIYKLSRDPDLFAVLVKAVAPFSISWPKAGRHVFKREHVMSRDDRKGLASFQTATPIRLSLLWAALMGLYIYNDYFSLYLPRTIEDMSAGVMGPLGAMTDIVLLTVALILAISAMMIFLSAFLPPVLSRWSNILFGATFSSPSTCSSAKNDNWFAL